MSIDASTQTRHAVYGSVVGISAIVGRRINARAHFRCLVTVAKPAAVPRRWKKQRQVDVVSLRASFGNPPRDITQKSAAKVRSESIRRSSVLDTPKKREQNARRKRKRGRSWLFGRSARKKVIVENHGIPLDYSARSLVVAGTRHFSPLLSNQIGSRQSRCLLSLSLSLFSFFFFFFPRVKEGLKTFIEWTLGGGKKRERNDRGWWKRSGSNRRIHGERRTRCEKRRSSIASGSASVR